MVSISVCLYRVFNSRRVVKQGNIPMQGFHFVGVSPASVLNASRRSSQINVISTAYFNMDLDDMNSTSNISNIQSVVNMNPPAYLSETKPPSYSFVQRQASDTHNNI